jgi:O-methyltransferase
MYSLIRRIRNSRLLVGLRRPTYFEDGMISFRNVAFLEDNGFKKAYRAGKDTGSWGEVDIRWRAHVACWAAAHASRLPGDFVECGVNRGGLARTVIEYVRFWNLQKQFYLVDTYRGLIKNQISSKELERGIGAFYYEDCYDSVRQTFSKYSNVIVVRGAVPEVLPVVSTSTIAYLSIDMNCVLPEIAAIEFFWDRIVIGGVVLLDDYAFEQHKEQQTQFDNFAKSKGATILTSPTGQGILLKE